MSLLPSRFAQALACLLPTGWAWPRDLASVWMRLIAADAAGLQEHHDLVQQATQEWLPHATRTRLEEWEEATGLPDACQAAGQTYEARRAAVLARLRGHLGYYTDSSPAALANIEAVCAALGLTATVHRNWPFRVGRNRCGDRLGANDGKLYLVVAGTDEPFRVGRDRVGMRLVARPAGVVELACALEAMVPARYELVVVAA